MLGGLHVLAHRDEIRAPGARSVYFSTEVLPEVTPLPTSEREIACPRCRRPILAGTPAVRCPAPTCRIWHHASEKYPCWSYAESCALCPYPTDSEAGFQWTPEGL